MRRSKNVAEDLLYFETNVGGDFRSLFGSLAFCQVSGTNLPSRPKIQSECGSNGRWIGFQLIYLLVILSGESVECA